MKIMILIERIKSIKKEINCRIGIFLCFFTVIFLSFSIFMNDIMTSDYIPGYKSIGELEPLTIRNIISGARYVGALIHYIYRFLYTLNVSHYNNSWVLQIIGMFFYALSSTIIYSLFESYIDKSDKVFLYVYKLAILIMFVNPFMIETYIYGALDFGLGIFFAVIGAFLDFWDYLHIKQTYLL